MSSRWISHMRGSRHVGLRRRSAGATDTVRRAASCARCRTRMQQMEDKLQATDDQLESANAARRRAVAADRASRPRGDARREQRPARLPRRITVGGWVSANYFYNTNDPTRTPTWAACGDGNAGIDGAFYPLHPDHNSFALDQGLVRDRAPISEENRAASASTRSTARRGELNDVGRISNRDSTATTPSSTSARATCSTSLRSATA